MNCNCPSEEYVPTVVGNTLICTKTTSISNVTCPPGCVTVILEDGNAKCECTESTEPNYTDSYTPIDITPEHFEDVSWTVAYSPTMGTWISFYGFKPNYYVNHNNYFQTGINNSSDPTEFGIWSHLLTNKSYQVFYGKKQPFVVEYPIKEEFVTKTLSSVQLWTEARRYHNEYDYFENIGLT